MQTNNGKDGKKFTPGQGGLSWSSPASSSNAGKNTIPSAPLQRLNAPNKEPLGFAAVSVPAAPSKLKLSGIFGAGAIVGLLLGWSLFSSSDNAPAQIAANEEQEETGGQQPVALAPQTPEVPSVVPSAPASSQPALPAATPGASGAFSVPESQEAGITVAISRAVVSASTWVVVYESRNGAPGNILGAALFTPQRESGTVRLLRGTVAGQTYFVGQRRDDGDRVFSMEKDAPVLAADGSPLLAQFRAR